MGAVFTLGLLLFLAIGGILLLFFVWLPLFIIGIVRGKKGKRRWPFFLACGIVFFFALPMILPFPILVTVTTMIYNENNPVIGEKIKRKDDEFTFQGETYTALPYYYEGDKAEDPIVGTEISRFLWIETTNEYVYSFSPSYPYTLLCNMKDMVFAKKTEKDQVISYFDDSIWNWTYGRKKLSVTQEDDSVLRTFEEGQGEEIHISFNDLSEDKIQSLDALSSDNRIGLRFYRIGFYQDSYYLVGRYHSGQDEQYYSCYPLSEKVEDVLNRNFS